MKEVKSLLTDIVKEKQISKIILDYKFAFEYIDKFRHHYETRNMLAYISMLEKIDEKFLELNEEYIIWECILQHKNLSSKFLDKYFLKIKELGQVINMFVFQRLDEKIIEKYKEHYSYKDWYYISLKQKLSQEFLRKHTNDVFSIALNMNSNF